MKMSVLFAHVLIVLCHLSDAVAAQPPVERISRACWRLRGSCSWLRSSWSTAASRLPSQKTPTKQATMRPAGHSFKKASSWQTRTLGWHRYSEALGNESGRFRRAVGDRVGGLTRGFDDRLSGER